MERLIINGGNRLYGRVKIQGSKNSVLPIMAASILIKGVTIIRNYPSISDVFDMADILTSIGVEVIYDEDELIIDATNVVCKSIDNEAARRIRASVLFLGSMLSRFGEAQLPLPGGCNIGKRPIDIHLNGFKRLNAAWSIYEDTIHLEALKLCGNDIHLEYPSVGATENIILAAVLANGITVIHNAAREPEIVELCNYLTNAGGIIYGIGSSMITVKGVAELQETAIEVSADRIVTGTYMAACLACGGEVTLEKCSLSDTVGYLDVLTGLGLSVNSVDEGIFILSTGRIRNVNYIETRPFPGFPTDMQQIIMSVLAKSDGESVIRETIFENRLSIAHELNKMGANITLKDDYAYIHGRGGLVGTTIKASDLRGAAALVIAGIMAEGKTVIEDCDYINRGYYRICSDLKGLGADIQ